MKCPKCEEEINYVQIISYCSQDAEIDKNGKITNYDGDISVDGYDPLIAYCPMCYEDIIKYIKLS